MHIMKSIIKHAKRYISNVFWTFFGIILSTAISHWVGCVPDLNQMNNNIKELDGKVDDIHGFFIDDNETEGRECKVGYNKKLEPNQISIKADKNNFNLKRGDVVEITYLFSPVKVSVECIVSIIDKAGSKPTDADFFVSTTCLELLQIPKSEWTNEGVFEMYFRKKDQHRN